MHADAAAARIRANHARVLAKAETGAAYEKAAAEHQSMRLTGHVQQKRERVVDFIGNNQGQQADTRKAYDELAAERQVLLNNLSATKNALTCSLTTGSEREKEEHARTLPRRESEHR